MSWRFRYLIAKHLLCGRHVFVRIEGGRVKAVMGMWCSGPIDIEQMKIRFVTWRHLYIADSDFREKWAKLRAETQGA